MSRSQLMDTGGFNQLAQGKDGYYLYNQNDMYVGKAIEKYGEFSALEMSLLSQLCRPGDTVIEVGANIGSHTVGLAKRVGPTGRVLAFEPQRLLFQTLCANIALNSLVNVECYWAAVSSKPGTITVPEPDPTEEDNFAGISMLGADEGLQVDCLVLDRFLSLPRVKMLKVDVEGMEADVLRGGEQLIGRHKPIIYVENDRIDSSEALIRLIDSMGYRMYWHLPPLFNPRNFYSEKENIFPNVVSVNMICIHRDSKTELDGSSEIVDFSFHPMRR